MKQRFNMLGNILGILVILFPILFTATLYRGETVHATVRNDFIKKLTVTDMEGNPFTSTSQVGMYIPFRVNAEFEVAPDAKAGDTVTVQLPNNPSNLQFSTTENFSVRDGATNEVVGNATFDEAQKLFTLTFTDFVETHSDIKGSFYFYLKVDEQTITTDQTVPINISVNNEVKNAGEVNYHPVPNTTVSDMSKTGWRNIETDGSIVFKYRISLNRSQSNFENTVIHDFFQTPGLRYVSGSFRIEKGTWGTNAQGWILQNTTDVTDQFTFTTADSVDATTTPALKQFVVSSDNRSFAVNFGSVASNEGYQILYRSLPTAGTSFVDGQTYSNTATLTANNISKETKVYTDYYRRSGGSATGNTYQLNLKKTAEDGSTPLAGARFKITNKETNEVVKSADGLDYFESAADGSILVNYLLRGDYLIKEIQAPEGYVASQEEYTVTAADFVDQGNGILLANLNITNKKANTRELKVVKKWSDDQNRDGLQPSSVTVYLLKDGVRVKDDQNQDRSVQLLASNNWTASFTGLEETGNYTVEEATVPGYTVTYGTLTDNQITITNTHDIETTSVTGTKTWDDKNNQDGLRPEAITVNLLKNGTKVDSKSVTAAENWSYSFSNLPKYENGQEIVYTVTEDVVTNYTTSIEGYNITNSYQPGKTSLTVTKRWEDKDNQDGSRPTSVKVQLYADGQAVGDVVELTQDNRWTYTFSELDEKAKGKTIVYSVQEVDVPAGYTSQIIDEGAGNVTVVNTHTPTTPPVTPPTKPNKPKELPKTGSKWTGYALLAGLLLFGTSLYFLAKNKASKE
ncbi:Cna B-type domain-containing protein [Streptococcus sp. DD13]|uniref:Cna B-type domain-containing protein n=1 Tax=Streptococcus sp. DD13 TaxID=1777881 RepID=UPI0007924924|nr:Cna B-type domain-containing protein [Streptococcus sp. DD13]KXT77958.1 hypothetical protein STRDD13_01115 [Streptococcus sp. DD13]